MKKSPSTLPYMVLTLTLIGAVSAGLLAFFHHLTQPAIARAEAARRLQATESVLPLHDSVAPPDTVWVEGSPVVLYRAYLDEREVGAAVEASSLHGFNGEVRVMTGFGRSGRILEYAVLSQSETPGLGTKMTFWFRDSAHSIVGLNPSRTRLAVRRDGGDVDAITAATISSRAFLETVNAGCSAYTGVSIDAATGATSASAPAGEDTTSLPTDSTPTPATLNLPCLPDALTAPDSTANTLPVPIRVTPPPHPTPTVVVPTRPATRVNPRALHSSSDAQSAAATPSAAPQKATNPWARPRTTAPATAQNPATATTPAKTTTSATEAISSQPSASPIAPPATPTTPTTTLPPPEDNTPSESPVTPPENEEE